MLTIQEDLVKNSDLSPPELKIQAKKRYKILHVNQDFGNLGGIEKNILGFSKRMDELGPFESHIVCTADTPYYHMVREAGVIAHGIPFPDYLPDFFKKLYPRLIFRTFDLHTTLHLKKHLDRIKPDLIHAHHGRLENALFKLWGYPLVYTVHGYGSPFNLKFITCPKKRLLNTMLLPLFRWMVPFLDALTFVSRSEQERLIEEGFVPQNAPGTVIYNGLDIKNISERASKTDIQRYKQEFGIDPDAIVIGYPGRLDPDKNSLEILGLAKKLVTNHPEQKFFFIIAGEGSLKAHFVSEFNQPLLKGRGVCLGYRRDIPELLACCDLTISIALQEGFGLRILESLAAGIPCVSYNVGGIAEILDFPEGHRLMVPSGDLEALYQKIFEILSLSSAQKQQMNVRLLERARQFDIDTYVNNFIKVFTDILEPSKTIALPTTPKQRQGSHY
jgi:glycosyltransferase involved in cell wall biosynthesis